jgi:hypothetical protein
MVAVLLLVHVRVRLRARACVYVCWYCAAQDLHMTSLFSSSSRSLSPSSAAAVAAIANADVVCAGAICVYAHQPHS